jgi:hypothetical protein
MAEGQTFENEPADGRLLECLAKELERGDKGPDSGNSRIGRGCHRCFPSVREQVLRAAGWALVLSEPAAPADIIVLSAESAGAGMLEAADLVQSGIATRVAVFADPPNGEDHEFIRRGLPYGDSAASQIRLRGLDVTDVVQIPRTDVGSESEGQVLSPRRDQHQFRSIVFVAARDHSRRLRRVLDRVMKGHPTRVMVRSARCSRFDPDRWWETRDGVRTEIVELEKLLFEAILHPMSFLASRLL